MKSLNWKELGIDIIVDIFAGLLIAVGIYNFAFDADFPVEGFSGIAIILYHIFHLPIGVGLFVLNIPAAIFSFKLLGRMFFLKSIKTIVITSIIMDHVAPLLPIYTGSRLLAAICMGVFCGIGYAMVFMRGSSSGGQDFISVPIRKMMPHITLGTISIVQNILIILLGTILIFRDVDGLIYGIIATWLISAVMDRIMYGTDKGKLTLIVTENGLEIAEQIDKYSGRGSTILKGIGSHSKEKKDVVMCACNNKQMYTIKKMVRKADPDAFTIIMESNEVIGEGFKNEVY